MENIHLNSPYKIISSKHKRYTSHYDIPGADCIILPKKVYGDQILSDVVWKDANGEIHHKNDLMFSSANIEQLNAMKDFILYSIWEDISKTEEAKISD